jgi:hypothetical protein
MEKKDAGNAMIYVLIGIALFAALAYTFMRGGKSAQSGLSSNQSKIAAQDILDYAADIEKAVNRLRGNGCSENQLSFETADALPNAAAYANANAPGDYSCHIFHESGGRMVWKSFQEYMTSPETARIVNRPAYSGQTVIQDVGTTAPELFFVLPDLPVEICNAINKSAGITGAMANDTYTAGPFTGSFASTSTLADNGTNPATVAGKTAFCMYNGSQYFFMKVLIER